MKSLWILVPAALAVGGLALVPILSRGFSRLSDEHILALAAATMVVLTLTMVLVTMTFTSKVDGGQEPRKEAEDGDDVQIRLPPRRPRP